MNRFRRLDIWKKETDSETGGEKGGCLIDITHIGARNVPFAITESVSESVLERVFSQAPDETDRDEEVLHLIRTSLDALARPKAQEGIESGEIPFDYSPPGSQMTVPLLLLTALPSEKHPFYTLMLQGEQI